MPDPTPNRERDAVASPRWVKIFGLVALLVVVVFVVLLLFGRGGHGPGRHLSDRGGGHIPPAGIPRLAEQQP